MLLIATNTMITIVQREADDQFSNLECFTNINSNQNFSLYFYQSSIDNNHPNCGLIPKR